jgi:hypothetical protein
MGSDRRYFSITWRVDTALTRSIKRIIIIIMMRILFHCMALWKLLDNV